MNSKLESLSLADGKTLVETLMDLSTERQVDEFLGEITKVNKWSWMTVGAPNVKEAAAAISAQPDPIMALVDRIDNMHDAIIEKNRPTNLKSEPDSPREAVASWLGLSKDLSQENQDKLRTLGKMAQILFVLTPRDGFPTVKFRDFGTGCINQRGELDLRSTILSLLHGNKATKKYVIGVFGFGGSTTYWHCNFAIILSRPNLLTGVKDVVAWTIVRRRPPQGSERRDQIEYLVSPEGECPVVDASLLPPDLFPSGTYVAHIEYNLRSVLGTSKLLVTGNDMLYQRFRYLLFNTVLPFWIDAVDMNGNPIRNREGKPISQGRTMSGALGILKESWNADKARKPENREQILFHDTYKNKDGLATRYWIFNIRRNNPEAVEEPQADSGQPEKQRPPFISRYLDAWYRYRGNPVVLTINGRTHYAFPVTIFREFGLALLENHLLIQIDCDEMNWEARRNLFNKIASTRSDIKHELTDTLMDELRKALGRDNQDLWSIVDYLTQRILSQTTEDKRVDKVLRKIILNFEARTSGKGGRVIGEGALPATGHAGTPTYHPSYIPTVLEFDDYADPTEIEIGSKKVLNIVTDAPDDILERDEARAEFEIQSTAPETQFTVAYSPPRMGLIRLYVEAQRGVLPGCATRLSARLIVHDQQKKVSLQTDQIHLVAHTINEPEYVPVDPPSKLLLASTSDPIKLKKGRITSLTLEFNGPDDMFERDSNRGELEGHCSIEGIDAKSGQRGPYRGHMSVHVYVPENIDEGLVGLLTYRLRVGALVLETSRNCVVVSYKKRQKRYGKSEIDEKVANFEAKWVNEGDVNWVRFGWTREKHVARHEEMGNGKLVMWVNRDYQRLKQFFRFRREKVTTDQANLDTEQYRMQIAYYAWQRYKDGQSDSGEDVQAEYQRVAETTMIGLLPLNQVELF
jgi:hypothetical protein